MTSLYKFIKKEPIIFIGVGIINTLFGYGCFSLLLYIGLHYTLAILLGTILGVLFNFKSTGTLVFKSHNNRLIFRFVASYAIIYSLNVIGMEAFLHFGLTPYSAGAILILPMAAISFMLQKKFVFNNG